MERSRAAVARRHDEGECKRNKGQTDRERRNLQASLDESICFMTA
jgi:hypothetical protein